MLVDGRSLDQSERGAFAGDAIAIAIAIVARYTVPMVVKVMIQKYMALG